MAFSKTIVADSVITRLIESQGIFQLANRAFDSMVRPGASSLDAGFNWTDIPNDFTAYDDRVGLNFKM